jgi:hypothetical protein
METHRTGDHQREDWLMARPILFALDDDPQQLAAVAKECGSASIRPTLPTARRCWTRQASALPSSPS